MEICQNLGLNGDGAKSNTIRRWLASSSISSSSDEIAKKKKTLILFEHISNSSLPDAASVCSRPTFHCFTSVDYLTLQRLIDSTIINHQHTAVHPMIFKHINRFNLVFPPVADECAMCSLFMTLMRRKRRWDGNNLHSQSANKEDLFYFNKRFSWIAHERLDSLSVCVYVCVYSLYLNTKRGEGLA